MIENFLSFSSPKQDRELDMFMGLKTWAKKTRTITTRNPRSIDKWQLTGQTACYLMPIMLLKI
jgi:hypothetical protein